MLSKFGQFVGKGFCNGDLFVLDVETNASTCSAYIVAYVDTWNSRLGHVNIKSIKSMNFIPKLAMSEMQKCQVCNKAKYHKKPFNKVTKRQTQLLELIHTNLADYKNVVSKSGHTYHTTFVDEGMFLIYKIEVENN